MAGTHGEIKAQRVQDSATRTITLGKVAVALAQLTEKYEALLARLDDDDMGGTDHADLYTPTIRVVE